MSFAAHNATPGREHRASTEPPARNRAPQIRPPWAVLWSDNPSIHIYGMVDEGAAVPMGGQAQISEIARDRRTPLTVYAGQNAKHVPLPLLFDTRLADDDPSPKTVRQRIKDLNSLRAAHDASGGEPPVVRFNTGGLIDYDFTHGRDYEWWVEDVTWGDRESTRHGVFVSVACVVSLIAYMPPQTVKSVANRAAKKRAKKPTSAQLASDAAQTAAGLKKKKLPSRPQDHVVKIKESLQDVASSALGDASRWTEIMDLNDIPDPRSLPVGMRLKLPL